MNPSVKDVLSELPFLVRVHVINYVSSFFSHNIVYVKITKENGRQFYKYQGSSDQHGHIATLHQEQTFSDVLGMYFGYFREDRFRKPFQIFRFFVLSVSMATVPYDLCNLVPCKNVEKLCIFGNGLNKCRVNEKRKFPTITSLQVRLCNLRDVSLQKLFSVLPNVKHYWSRLPTMGPSTLEIIAKRISKVSTTSDIDMEHFIQHGVFTVFSNSLYQTKHFWMLASKPTLKKVSLTTGGRDVGEIKELDKILEKFGELPNLTNMVLDQSFSERGILLFLKKSTSVKMLQYSNTSQRDPVGICLSDLATSDKRLQFVNKSLVDLKVYNKASMEFVLLLGKNCVNVSRLEIRDVHPIRGDYHRIHEIFCQQFKKCMILELSHYGRRVKYGTISKCKNLDIFTARILEKRNFDPMVLSFFHSDCSVRSLIFIGDIQIFADCFILNFTRAVEIEKCKIMDIYLKTVSRRSMVNPNAIKKLLELLKKIKNLRKIVIPETPVTEHYVWTKEWNFGDLVLKKKKINVKN